jgi:hypothetical protein
MHILGLYQTPAPGNKGSEREKGSKGNEREKKSKGNEREQGAMNKRTSRLLGYRGTKGTKEQLYGLVRERYSLLIQKKTATKKTHDLEALHDSIRKFVIDSEPLFRKAHVIGLENQPVLKNPTMKTVQILLYATLRDVLQPPPKMKLIHALKKVADKESGDKGYADRKKASIERVNSYFKTHTQPQMKELLDKAVKKADLCDALCMCLDYKV